MLIAYWPFKVLGWTMRSSRTKGLKWLIQRLELMLIAYWPFEIIE